MQRMVMILTLLMAGVVLPEETIDLSGTVSNQSGKPLNGAIVTLAGQGIADTTDANGQYAFSYGKVELTSVGSFSMTQKVIMNNGILHLSLTNSVPVKIELFDMKGNLLRRVTEWPSSAGEYQYDLTTRQYAATVIIVRVGIGRRVSSFRYLPFASGCLSFSAPVAPKLVSDGLAKVQATVDTLKISASGYAVKTVAISSYTTTINISLDSITLDKFSFFVTSLKALQELSGSDKGFGGDFRFGKTGQGAGLLGADSICQCIAEKSMPGSKVKQWRAFLSVAKGPGGTQVNAIDRVGQGPWYDRLGRLLAPTVADLKNTRPMNGDATIKNDLPNEDGVPNHRPDGKTTVDNHHMVTGSQTDGTLLSGKTCEDWTSVSTSVKARCGFAWPRGTAKTSEVSMGAGHWISGFDASGCAAGIQITEQNGGAGNIIGSGGGYGGFYCFALTP